MTLFKNTTYTVGDLVHRIQRGEVGLPDLQRPFVWDASKVRDLFDSLYRGFPVGSLHLWETGAQAGARQIGDDRKQTIPHLLVVDGQQRLTSLFAAITGSAVVNEKYQEVRVRIAFRPADGAFQVCDAAIEKDPEYIPDISLVLGQRGTNKTINRFLSRLGERRTVDEDEQDHLATAIDQLHDILGYTFHAVELSSSVEPEAVADIFVRINSKGTPLNQSDFILTLMSVFWDSGRRELEQFSRSSRVPSTTSASSFNWHLQPRPSQLLRTSIAVAFRRAVLKAVYSLLRGHDMRGGMLDSAQREEQFARLQRAQEQVLDISNWHEFLRCLEHAGFRSARIISSQNTIVYSYALWLIGRIDHGIAPERLRDAVARWFFMAQITSRYTGSFESRAEADLALLGPGEVRNGDEFLRRMDKVVSDTLTHDFWKITLPNDLSTSASGSPALFSYLAALNILDADVLLSKTKIRSQMDPALLANNTVERQHLFPRGFLRNSLGLQTVKEINQIANMAIVEWASDVVIGDRAPSEYWPEQVRAARLSESRLDKQRYLHAVPDGWEKLDYDTFLEQRRRGMAAVVHDAFDKLGEVSYQPHYDPPTRTYVERDHDMSGGKVTVLGDLLTSGLIEEGARMYAAEADVAATILADGRIRMDGEIYPSLATASVAAGAAGNIENFWQVETKGGVTSLRELFIRYRRLS
ncbi:DUF262 domain-containing protein [Saccharomonospora xinjiangensis]|uniref:GmrSD restriction endonuclease domain-containing protein n=1 Tax=Saccharomonospora xinjiangensis TaxID=75294 RepID=UPI001070583A|nr:DUF262 domain-containing protein [Saccharomonospora xinjiangensis]QBQ61264.1 hypothetical protein EYD13_14580 [Saccharomonospora xinjiangensis]